MKDQIKLLNRYLTEQKHEGLDRFVEIYEHEYIQNKIIGVVSKYYKHTGSNFEDIKSECKVLFFELLEEFDGNNLEKISYQFLNFLDLTLYNRLQDNSNNISLSEESHDYNYTSSLDRMELKPEIISDNYVEGDFSKGVVHKIMLSGKQTQLTDRELEVYKYVFEKDFTHTKTAGILNISRQRVSQIVQNIIRKIN